MNLLTDVRWFSIVGLFVALAMVGAALITNSPGNSAVDLPATPTPGATATVDPNATPTRVTVPTVAPKQYAGAEKVIDAAGHSYTATVKTAKGEFVLKLYADKAPNTVNSFVFLAEDGFYDGITFHRVIANFVAQAGDPTATGSGGPGYQTPQEQTDLKNKRGTVAMARAQGSLSFGSQFFINLKDNPGLDEDAVNQARFYPFAEVVSGMDVVDRIGQGDVIESITISSTPK